MFCLSFHAIFLSFDLEKDQIKKIVNSTRAVWKAKLTRSLGMV